MHQQPNHNFTTLFEKPAQRVGDMSRNWAVFLPVLIGVCVLFAFISVVAGGNRLYMPGALIVIPLSYLFRKRKYDDVLVYVVNDPQKNLRYGFVNPDQQYHDNALNEYAYWYATDPKNPSSSEYELYFEIISDRETIYLKEVINANYPPDGWTESDVRIAEKKGMILLNGLQELAFKIDKIAG